VPLAYGDAGLRSLPFAAAWIASLLLLGIGLRRRASVASSFALGCAVVVPVLALASALRVLPAGAFILGAGGAALGLRALLRARKNGGRYLPTLRRRDAPAWALALVATIGCAAWFPTVFRPELSYDVLSYHLPVARHFRAGFGLLDGNYYSRLPSAPFLLYAPVVPSPDATLEAPGVRLMLWCALAAGAALCARVAGQLGARRTARAAAAALYAWHPMVAGAQINSNSDLFTALFALAAAERALSALRTRRRHDWALAGFLAGTAVATKFSALGIVLIPMLAGLAAAIVPTFLSRRSPQPSSLILHPFLFLLLFAALAYAPWAIRAVAVGGNPLHPFVGEAPGWSADQNAFLVAQHRPQSPLSGDYWRDAAAKADVLGYALAVVPPDPITGEGGLRVSVVLVLVLASLARLRHAGTRFVVVAILAGCAAWLTVGLAPGRFAMPCVGLALALAVATVSKAPYFGLRVGGWALLGLAFAFSTLGLVRSGTASAPWRAEAWTRNGLLPANVHRAALDPEASGRLLLLFEARGRWFPENAVSNTVWDVPTWADDLKAAADATDFARRLRARGIERLFVNEFEWSRLVNFYGDLKPKPAMGTVGVAEHRADVARWLAAYPPFRFAGFDDADLGVLAEFLVLARSQATQTAPAGPVSAIWLAPVPQVPPAPESPSS